LCILDFAALLCVTDVFFSEANINVTNYLDMLENYVFPTMEEEEVLMFKHKGAPPHYCNTVHDVLKVRFPGHWRRRPGPLASELT
jgi:hypothetical protein